METVDTILARIRVGVSRHGHKKQVIVEAGVKRSRVADIGKPDWNPTADTIRRLDAAVQKLFPAEPPAPPHQPE